MPKNGIDMPSLSASLGFPQYVWEASAIDFSNRYEQRGALNPQALTTFLSVTLELQGGFSVSSFTNCFSASLGFLVGGILKDILTSEKGSKTFPADTDSGNPDPPITAICAFHPLVITDFRIFSWALCSPSTIGKSLMAYWPFVLTRSYIYSYLFGGISTQNDSWTSPVWEFQRRSRSCLMIRQDEGTIPEASPLCTPSVNTSTLRVPDTMPLSELVIHNLSQSRVPLSRQKKRVGFPILSLSLRMQGPIWAEPLYSSPQVIITHRGILIPCFWRAFMAINVPYVEYPSSAPPLPQSLSPWMTGWKGPSPSFHPVKGGCLSQ